MYAEILSVSRRAFLVLLFCLAGRVLAVSADEQHARQGTGAVLQASGPSEAQKAQCAFFNSATEPELRELLGDANAGIALRAAWERVRRSIAAERQQLGEKVDRLALRRFVGFAEGRLRGALPSD